MKKRTGGREPLRMHRFHHMANVVPAGKREHARVEHFDVSVDDARLHNMRCMLQPGSRFSQIEPGRYARLYSRGELVMSDTPYELWTNMHAVDDATGDVLVGGLGLGLVLLPMLRKKDVRSVMVVEKNLDVVALVAPAIAAAAGLKWEDAMLVGRSFSAQTGRWTDRLKVEGCDIRHWAATAGKLRFDYIYLDIWPNICADDYVDHIALRRMYRRLQKRPGKTASWQFEHLQELHKSGRWR